MTTFLSEHSLISKCFYRMQGAFCFDGLLYSYANHDQSLNEQGVYAEPVMVGNEINVTCPACEGRGVILTGRGREVLTFMDVFARPLLRDLVDEIFKEREQT